MKIENRYTFERHLKSGINMFLGAGFSVEALGLYKGKATKMPTGDSLRKELIDHFKYDPNSKYTLAQLCQILSSTKKEDLNSFLRKRFETSYFDPAYKNLEKINIKSFFTTNIDDLIFKIYKDSVYYYINDINLRGISMPGSSAIDYIALHGSIVHEPSKGFDFSPVELATSFERDSNKWHTYISKIKTTPTLYWGYRLADSGVLQAISKENTAEGKKNSWIVLRSEDKEDIEYFESLGFQIIIAETKELLQYFGEASTSLDSEILTHGESLVDRFKEFLPPMVGDKIPVRRISEFYYGSEPTWFDIFFGNLHKTSHYYAAENEVSGGRNVILVGAAVTGKSTLLKQLTQEFSSVIKCLYIDEITVEKATLLRDDIDFDRNKVIIFIDNGADAWEAISILNQSKLVQIVVAERDYIFDSIAHRFPQHEFVIMEVSGLERKDIQSIEEKISGAVDQRRFNRHRHDELIKHDLDPTFFEVMRSNTISHILTDRFITAINDLKLESPEKHDLLSLYVSFHSH